MTELCNIMKNHGSDKGGGWHNYTEKYYEIFESIKNKPMNIFELGLGTNFTDTPSNMGVNGKPGASLYGWREYFKNSKIFGADIDKRILFKSDNIETFYCDQKNPTDIKNMWENELLKNITFDIIIDDGLHEYEANIIFFENSIHKLNKGGFFIIEDLLNESISSFENKISEYKITKPELCFEIVKLEHDKNIYDNNFLIIKYK